jgi:4-alpha-glucanotransferase
VREALADYRIFSYRVFYFERNDQGDFKNPAAYPAHSLATISTHDLPTLAGFWTAEDISLRNRLGLFADEAQYLTALTNRRKEKEKIVQRLVSSDFLSNNVLDNPDSYTRLTSDVHSAIIGFLLSTPAKLAILSQEDLFKDTRQQNLPGTVSEHPNWSTKMKYTVEELWLHTDAYACTQLFRKWIERTGRSSQ